MNELDYIRWIRSVCSAVQGGNDAASLDIDGARLVFTTDMLVEGTHYERGTPGCLAGRKAVAVSLSDIAAMGAEPLCATISVCFRDGCGDAYSRDIFEGAAGIAGEFGLDIVGGDTTSSDACSSLCVSALGRAPEGGGLGRNGAKRGDEILVTGTLGGSILGRHLTFVPRVREALRMLECARPSAMMDISDGLACDLAHILAESGVGAEIDEESIPVSDAARDMSKRDGKGALWHAMNDGEDFELLLTASPEDSLRLKALDLECGLTSIGRITARSGEAVHGGYEHEW